MARRALAAPFVVTISLAAFPACDSSKTEVADAKKSDDGKKAEGGKKDDAKKPEDPPRVHKNPPALPPEPDPVPEDSKDETKDEPEEIDPFKPPKNRITKGKETILLEADGTCVSQVDTTCAPGKHCNPPPPKTVKCPADLQLPKATKKADVYRRPDRTCWEKGEAECAEGEECPPPPSTRVVCPAGLAVPK